MLQRQSQGLQCQNQQDRQKLIQRVQNTCGMCTHLKHVFLHCVPWQISVPHEVHLKSIEFFPPTPHFEHCWLSLSQSPREGHRVFWSKLASSLRRGDSRPVDCATVASSWPSAERIQTCAVRSSASRFLLAHSWLSWGACWVSSAQIQSSHAGWYTFSLLLLCTRSTLL